jgi:hypothetical protein
MLMDVIPLDASLVKGSHGRRTLEPDHQPVLICEGRRDPLPPQVDSTDVFGLLTKMF